MCHSPFPCVTPGGVLLHNANGWHCVMLCSYTPQEQEGSPLGRELIWKGNARRCMRRRAKLRFPAPPNGSAGWLVQPYSDWHEVTPLPRMTGHQLCSLISTAMRFSTAARGCRGPRTEGPTGQGGAISAAPAHDPSGPPRLLRPGPALLEFRAFLSPLIMSSREAPAGLQPAPIRRPPRPRRLK